MRLGRVEASGGFLLLLAWLNYTDTQGLIPQAIASCSLHEAGHWLAIQAVGGKVRRMRLGIAGAEMELGRPLSYSREALCALAGPGVSLALAWLGHFLPGGALFTGINLVLALFNLLPVSGLDGGRVLHCALCALAGPEAAERTAGLLDGFLVGVLVAGGGILAWKGGSITLLFTAGWLFSSIWREKEGKRGCQIGVKRVK